MICTQELCILDFIQRTKLKGDLISSTFCFTAQREGATLPSLKTLSYMISHNCVEFVIWNEIEKDSRVGEMLPQVPIPTGKLWVHNAWQGCWVERDGWSSVSEQKLEVFQAFSYLRSTLDDFVNNCHLRTNWRYFIVQDGKNWKKDANFTSASIFWKTFIANKGSSKECKI